MKVKNQYSKLILNASKNNKSSLMIEKLLIMQFLNGFSKIASYGFLELINECINK